MSSSPERESSSTKLLSKNISTPQVSLLLDFRPMEFFFELFQTVDNVLCDCLDSLKASLEEKSFPTQYKPDIEKGIQTLQDCLVHESDYQFDLFELYALYNIFRIPSNLSNLPPSLTLSSDTIDSELASTLDKDLEEVLTETRSLRYCKRHLEHELGLLSSDLDTFDAVRPILRRVAEDNPLFLSKENLATTMNVLQSILKSSEKCTKLKQEIEQKWLPSDDAMPHALNPRLEFEVSNVSLEDLQKMTLKLRHQF